MPATWYRRLMLGGGIVMVCGLFFAHAGRGQDKPAPAAGDRKMLWDGEKVFPKSFGHAEPKEGNAFGPQTDEVHQGKVALELAAKKAYAQGDKSVVTAGFNWHGWWPEDSGDDLTAYTHLVFWMKVETGKKVERVRAGLVSSKPKQASPLVDVTKYCPEALDGAWHQVSIPAADLIVEGAKFNPKLAWELNLESKSDPAQLPYSLYFDEISYERRAAATQPTAK